jgi:hypothetical protein
VTRLVTIELTPAQTRALEYALRIFDDVSRDSTLASVRRDVRTLAPVRARLHAATTALDAIRDTPRGGAR